jgi:hypothetical protein
LQGTWGDVTTDHSGGLKVIYFWLFLFSFQPFVLHILLLLLKVQLFFFLMQMLGFFGCIVDIDDLLIPGLNLLITGLGP